MSQSSRHPASRTSSSKGSGTASRMERHNEVRRNGGTPRQAIAAYTAGNKWATENARAVGNLPN
jgi:hypothetical protein